jgi:beta-glucosidase
MLKNEGKILPVLKGAKVAVVGPFGSGAHDLIGGWCVYGDDRLAVDLATGLRNAGGNIILAEGCAIDAPIAGGVEAAVAAAKASDVVLLAIGESQDMSGEAQSRTDIVVPAAQMALAEAVHKVGKPVVVILKNGRALALQGAVREAAAILVTWYLGSESGNAIADIVYGKFSPSGRLPVSFPFESGQEPFHYDHKATGRPQPDGARLPYKAQYRSVPNAALFPFGHGLTYGDVRYSDLRLSSTEMHVDGQIEIGAVLTNTGSYPVEEVAQLYIHDRVASVSRPVRELKAFEKVALQPGETKHVKFRLSRADLLFIGLNDLPTVEPGRIDVWVAPSAQATGVQGSFELRVL